jgi:hypothetical protein
MIKSPVTRAMCGGTPLRTAEAVVKWCNDNLDGKGSGGVDSSGIEYLGLTTIFVPASDVAVPNVDYHIVVGTQSFHQLITTGRPNELWARKRSCLTCNACLSGSHRACTNPDADIPESPVTVQRISLTAAEVLAATKTRQGEDERRKVLAIMAKKDSFVGVSMEGSTPIQLVRVTQPLHQSDKTFERRNPQKDFLPGDDILEVKMCVGLTNPRSFSLARAKDVFIAASEVRTAPVEYEVTKQNAWGDPQNITIAEDLINMATDFY